MKKIILATVNARYIHTSIGLRYLFANLSDLRVHTSILEFIKSDKIEDMAEAILKENPNIIGLSVYIWNAIEITELIKLLKSVAPEKIIILGGPEVSHFPFRLNYDSADYIIQGEGDILFYQLCSDIFNGKRPSQKVLNAEPVDIMKIELPYDYYTEEDVKNRVIYMEVSRGCPFSCEFCLSSIDKLVRYFDVEIILNHLETFWQRGVRKIKFIDRTFNLNFDVINQILDFFLSKEQPYLIHFEVIPEHFPISVMEKLKLFPPASLQLEVGIQTLNPVIAKNISRKINVEKIFKNISFLENETKTHIHFDLIIGLPGESLESFGENLNRLMKHTDAEIQIGILKKLSGTDLCRHDENFGMIYSDSPPYEILQNDLIPFSEMQIMKRLARFWELYYNSGNFRKSIRLIWDGNDVYLGFYEFSLWVYENTSSTWQISLNRLAELLFKYLTKVKKYDVQKIADLLIQDILVFAGRRPPTFLREFVKNIPDFDKKSISKSNKRQIKHN